MHHGWSYCVVLLLTAGTLFTLKIFSFFKGGHSDFDFVPLANTHLLIFPVSTCQLLPTAHHLHTPAAPVCFFSPSKSLTFVKRRGCCNQNRMTFCHECNKGFFFFQSSFFVKDHSTSKNFTTCTLPTKPPVTDEIWLTSSDCDRQKVCAITFQVFKGAPFFPKHFLSALSSVNTSINIHIKTFHTLICFLFYLCVLLHVLNFDLHLSKCFKLFQISLDFYFSTWFLPSTSEMDLFAVPTNKVIVFALLLPLPSLWFCFWVPSDFWLFSHLFVS